jgi:hypothetical protein
MAYHDDLLSQALLLVHTSPSTQASLRRAVSAAYYGVFHLLIAEATSNWSNVKLRAALGRAYDHGIMRTASNRLSNTRDFPFVGEDPQVVATLRFLIFYFYEPIIERVKRELRNEPLQRPRERASASLV